MMLQSLEVDAKEERWHGLLIMIGRKPKITIKTLTVNLILERKNKYFNNRDLCSVSVSKLLKRMR